MASIDQVGPSSSFSSGADSPHWFGGAAIRRLPVDQWRPRNASRRLGSFSLTGQRVHWITGSAAAGASFRGCAHSGRLEISSTADLVVRCGPGLKWTRRIYGLFGRAARSRLTRGWRILRCGVYLSHLLVRPPLPLSSFTSQFLLRRSRRPSASCCRRAFRNRPPIRTFHSPRLVLELVRVVVRVEETTPADWRPPLNAVTRHRQVKSGTPFRA